MRPAEAGFALMVLLSLANLGAENVVSSRPKDENMLGSGKCRYGSGIFALASFEKSLFAPLTATALTA